MDEKELRRRGRLMLIMPIANNLILKCVGNISALPRPSSVEFSIKCGALPIQVGKEEQG